MFQFLSVFFANKKLCFGFRFFFVSVRMKRLRYLSIYTLHIHIKQSTISRICDTTTIHKSKAILFTYEWFCFSNEFPYWSFTPKLDGDTEIFMHVLFIETKSFNLASVGTQPKPFICLVWFSLTTQNFIIVIGCSCAYLTSGFWILKETFLSFCLSLSVLNVKRKM